MVRSLPLTVSIYVLLLSGMTRAAEPDERPSIEQLFAGVPVISPEVEGIQQFSYSFDFAAGESTVLRGHYYWKRGEPAGLYFSTEQQEAPAWFVAEETAMLFDIAQQEIVLIRKAHPYVQFGVKEEKVSLTYGFEVGKEETNPSLEVQKFLGILADEKSLTRSAADEWVVQALSDTGKTSWKMTFAPQSPHALREITSHAAQGNEKLALRFHHIRVNQPPLTPWPRMPPSDAWPEGLAVNEHRSSNGETRSDWPQYALRILATHMAIDDESIRAPAWSRNLDWQQIRQIRDHFGPQLRHLIGFREPVE